MYEALTALGLTTEPPRDVEVGETVDLSHLSDVQIARLEEMGAVRRIEPARPTRKGDKEGAA